jgi:hypothetical protein
MRKVKCHRIHAMTVEQFLEEFNERANSEFGIEEEDIISFSVEAATDGVKVHTPQGGKPAKVIVSVFFWSRDKPSGSAKSKSTSVSISTGKGKSIGSSTSHTSTRSKGSSKRT